MSSVSLRDPTQFPALGHANPKQQPSVSEPANAWQDDSQIFAELNIFETKKTEKVKKGIDSQRAALANCRETLKGIVQYIGTLRYFEPNYIDPDATYFNALKRIRRKASETLKQITNAATSESAAEPKKMISDYVLPVLVKLINGIDTRVYVPLEESGHNNYLVKLQDDTESLFNLLEEEVEADNDTQKKKLQSLVLRLVDLQSDFIKLAKPVNSKLKELNKEIQKTDIHTLPSDFHRICAAKMHLNEEFINSSLDNAKSLFLHRSARRAKLVETWNDGCTRLLRVHNMLHWINDALEYGYDIYSFYKDINTLRTDVFALKTSAKNYNTNLENNTSSIEALKKMYETLRERFNTFQGSCNQKKAHINAELQRLGLLIELGDTKRSWILEKIKNDLQLHNDLEIIPIEQQTYANLRDMVKVFKTTNEEQLLLKQEILDRLNKLIENESELKQLKVKYEELIEQIKMDIPGPETLQPKQGVENQTTALQSNEAPQAALTKESRETLAAKDSNKAVQGNKSADQSTFVHFKDMVKSCKTTTDEQKKRKQEILDRLEKLIEDKQPEEELKQIKLKYDALYRLRENLESMEIKRIKLLTFVEERIVAAEPVDNSIKETQNPELSAKPEQQNGSKKPVQTCSLLLPPLNPHPDFTFHYADYFKKYDENGQEAIDTELKASLDTIHPKRMNLLNKLTEMWNTVLIYKNELEQVLDWLQDRLFIENDTNELSTILGKFKLETTSYRSEGETNDKDLNEVIAKFTTYVNTFQEYSTKADKLNESLLTRKKEILAKSAEDQELLLALKSLQEKYKSHKAVLNIHHQQLNDLKNAAGNTEASAAEISAEIEKVKDVFSYYAINICAAPEGTLTGLISNYEKHLKEREQQIQALENAWKQILINFENSSKSIGILGNAIDGKNEKCRFITTKMYQFYLNTLRTYEPPSKYIKSKYAMG